MRLNQDLTKWGPSSSRTLGHMLAFRDVLTCFPSAEPGRAQQASPASQSSASHSCGLAFSSWIVTKTAKFFVCVLAEFPGPGLMLHCYGRAWNGAVWMHGWLCNSLTACLHHMKKQMPPTTRLAASPKKQSWWSYSANWSSGSRNTSFSNTSLDIRKLLKDDCRYVLFGAAFTLHGESLAGTKNHGKSQLESVQPEPLAMPWWDLQSPLLQPTPVPYNR